MVAEMSIIFGRNAGLVRVHTQLHQGCISSYTVSASHRSDGAPQRTGTRLASVAERGGGPHDCLEGL